MEFLQRLLINAPGPVFVIVDGHPTYKAKSVKKFVEAQRGNLKVFYLPAYSPELNPDELVWNDLKNNCVGRKILTSREELQNHVRRHLLRLQKMPKLIRSFFRTPTTKYAAL